MNRIIEFWEASYYTHVGSSLLGVAALFACLKAKKNDKLLGTLSYFILLYILTNFISLFDVATNHIFDPWSRRVFDYMDLLETIVELIVFSNFIAKTITLPKPKLVLKWIPLLFVAYVVSYFAINNRNGFIYARFLQNIFTVQAGLLIIGCSFYFFDLFRKEPYLNLLAVPSFWVITGLSFFMVCTFPFAIIGQILLTSNSILYFQLFCLYNIFYCILFSMIIKASLCEPLAVKLL